jgi:hypothetical protein
VNRFVFYAFKFLSALLQLYAWQFLARSPPLLFDEALRIVTDLRGIHLPIADDEGGEPQRHAVALRQLHRGVEGAL